MYNDGEFVNFRKKVEFTCGLVGGSEVWMTENFLPPEKNVVDVSHTPCDEIQAVLRDRQRERVSE